MNYKTVATVSLGVVIGLLAWSSLRQSAAQNEVRPEEQPWEYKVVAFTVENESTRDVEAHTKQINLLAAEGWEYVGLLCAGSGPYRPGVSESSWVKSEGNVLFKRPRR